MRKHFLLLFLMALLPLAGFAATPVDLSDGWYIKFTPATASFTGSDVKPTVTLAKDGVSEDLTTGFTVVWKDGDNVVEELIDANPINGYTVTVTADGTNTYSELAVPTKKFYVLKHATSFSTVGAVLSSAQTWRASGYDLLATTPVPSKGTVQYMVTDNNTVPAANDEKWSTTAPHATKVGTHYVYVKVDATDNWQAIAPALLGSVTINGTPLVAETDYTAPTALATSTFNFDNTDHALANAGAVLTAKCTKIMYSLDNDKWQETVPTGKDAMEYTIYWKAVGADGYLDATGSVTAKIEAVAPVVTTAATGATGLVYTGKAQPLITAAASASLGAKVVYYMEYSPTENGTYTAHGNNNIDILNHVNGTKAGYYKVYSIVRGGGNYLESQPVVTTVEIQKAELTVHTTALPKTYGEQDPTLEATYTGWQNNETAATAAGFTAPTLTRADGENVGEYLISATVNTGSADNYTFVYNAANYGKLTINPKTLSKDNTEFTWALDTDVKTYDGTKQTKTVATAKFLKYAVTGSNVAVNLNTPTDYAYVTENAVNAGNQAQVIVTGQGNYTGSVVLNFEIKKANVYIIPQNGTKHYGEADPTLTWKVVKASDGTTEVPNADLKGTVALAREEGEAVSTYKIYVKSYTSNANDNYAPINVFDNVASADAGNKTAIFTITQAGEGLVLKFREGAVATKVYGNANPAWTIDDLEYVSGRVGKDTWETIKPTLSNPVFAITSEHVSDNATNKATVTGLASTNYPSVTVQPMDFTVTARPIAIKVENQTINYGGELANTITTNWSIVDADSYGSDWNGNTSDAASVTLFGLTLETVNAAASYAPGDTYEKAIKAVITNPDYKLNDKCVWGNLTINAETAFVLADADENLDTKLASVDGESYAVKFGNMPIEAQKWYAMVLPFETTPEELVKKLGTFLIVNRLSSATISDDAAKKVTVKFGLEWNEIPAGVPFLIKTAKATNWNKTTTVNNNEFESRELKANIEGETKGAASFLGTYAYGKSLRWGYDLDGNAEPGFTYVDKDNTDWSTATLKYRYLDVKDQTWYNQKNSAQVLKPMEAYLKLAPEALNAHVFVEDFENGTTAIKSLSTDDIEGLKTSEGWYTIDGIRLQGAPTEKGIYINNGKKVVVK